METMVQDPNPVLLKEAVAYPVLWSLHLAVPARQVLNKCLLK